MRIGGYFQMKTSDQIDENTHIGSYARAHSPMANLWQNYRVRSGLTGFSPTSDSSVCD
jgi:hypothetical protein